MREETHNLVISHTLYREDRQFPKFVLSVGSVKNICALGPLFEFHLVARATFSKDMKWET
jgi:hypothetical protein